MKCAQPHRLARRQPLDAAAHLVGGLVRERQRFKIRLAAIPSRTHVRDSMRDNAGFAAAWSGENQQRPINVLDGGAGWAGIRPWNKSLNDCLSRDGNECRGSVRLILTLNYRHFAEFFVAGANGGPTRTGDFSPTICLCKSRVFVVSG